jgi:hypothetical protein
MRLLFNAALSVDAENLEDAWKLAKDVESEASAVSDSASLVVKMASVAVLEDQVERRRRRHGSDVLGPDRAPPAEPARPRR